MPRTALTNSRIGQFCIVGDGAHASIKRQLSGVMYLSSKNFKPDGLDLSKVDFITPEDFDRHFREKSKAVTKPRVGDVLVGIIGSLGAPYVVQPTDQFGLSSSVAILRPDRRAILPDYLYYWMRGDKFQSAVYGTKGGVAQSYLSLEMIRSLPLEFPSPGVQERIASILSAYDDLIENNTRRIKILEDMAQMLYREWFVNFRFPGHEKVRMVESELGPIPEGWTAPQLEQFLEHVIGGGWGEEQKSDEFAVPAYVIRGTDIPGARNGSLEKCPLRWHKESNFKSRKLEAGDLVFEVSGGSKGQPVGRSLYVGRTLLSQLDRDVICASFCKLLRPKPDLQLPETLYCFLIEAYTNGVIEKYQVQSTGISNFKFTAFVNEVRMPLASTEILTRFRDLATPLLEAVAVFGKRNANLRTTRDLLLPKLISGEISVDAADDHAAELMEQTA